MDSQCILLRLLVLFKKKDSHKDKTNSVVFFVCMCIIIASDNKKSSIFKITKDILLCEKSLPL